jgi:hypothetical protein
MKNLNFAAPSPANANSPHLAGWAKAPLRFIARGKPSSRRVNCNLCGARYRASSRFQRFCQTCRLENELYRLAEWLPTAEFSV